jgi:hypothetical protein
MISIAACSFGSVRPCSHFSKVRGDTCNSWAKTLASEVLLQHLSAVEASCERDVLFDVRCDISYREVLDSQIDIFDSLSQYTSR